MKFLLIFTGSLLAKTAKVVVSLVQNLLPSPKQKEDLRLMFKPSLPVAMVDSNLWISINSTA